MTIYELHEVLLELIKEGYGSRRILLDKYEALLSTYTDKDDGSEVYLMLMSDNFE